MRFVDGEIVYISKEIKDEVDSVFTMLKLANKKVSINVLPMSKYCYYVVYFGRSKSISLLFKKTNLITFDLYQITCINDKEDRVFVEANEKSYLDILKKMSVVNLGNDEN